MPSAAAAADGAVPTIGRVGFGARFTSSVYARLHLAVAGTPHFLMLSTLKEQLDAAIAAAEAKGNADPDAYRGSDWWQLSDAEEAVFKTDRDRWPRMMTVFHCYEGFK